MEPVVVLRDARLQVRPGDTARTTATVRNTGDLVEQYSLDVLGPAAAWAEVIPASISVVRNGETTVQLLFRPPAGPGTPADTVPFALRCVSRENPSSAALAEGDLAVGAIHEIVASITPAVARGRWKGRWTARFDNRGTAPATLRLSAADERQTLGFMLAPAELVVPPGRSGQVYLKARAARPTLLGAMRRQRVRLTYTRATEPHEPVSEGFVDTAFEQVSVLTRTTATLAGLALAGGVAALVLLSRGGPLDDAASSAVREPSAPTGFQARPGPGGVVKLSWDEVNGAKSYGLYRLDGDTVDAPVVGVQKIPAPQTVKEWENLSAGEQTCFYVTAVDDGGNESPPSQTGCSAAGAGTGAGTGPDATPTDGTESPEPTATESGGTKREPQGDYAIVEFFFKDDSVRTPEILKRKKAIDGILAGYGGYQSVLAAVDSSERLSAQYQDQDFRVLYVDGFDSVADAERFCVKVETDLPNCVAPESDGQAGGGQAGGVRPSRSPAPGTTPTTGWVTSEPEPLGSRGGG